MKSLLTVIAAVAVLILCATACGKKSGSVMPEETEEQNTRLVEALSVGDVKQASAMADSMSLFVDDFTPEQTVQVLMAFLTVHNDAAARRDRHQDLVTLRKFVDVYDIALSTNPKDTRAAFAEAHRINPDIDFDSLARDFRERLTSYDAATDPALTEEPEETPAAEPADTTTVAAANDVNDLPLELRPAQ